MPTFFPAAVYLLCFAASSLCAWLLDRGYRRSGARLLLWSGLCFILLALNNFAVVVDLLILPGNDLRVLRSVLALGAVGVLVFGFIWDKDGE